MKTLEPPSAITRARPLLPNSSPEALKERRNAQGIYKVAWIEQIDAHGLFVTWADGRGTFLLATHNNGHSCANLADRICSGDLSRARDQHEFIAACGGTMCDLDRLTYAVTGN